MQMQYTCNTAVWCDDDQLEGRIQSMNSAARIYRTRDAVVDMENVLNIRGFDLDRALKDDPNFTRHYRLDHPHDREITSVGIKTQGDLDPEEFHGWMHGLLATKGPDIFRMKGILSFCGAKERYVFQGVHMLFDGRMDRPWREGERSNSLIFIGRNLNREVLSAGFNTCLK